MIIWTLTTRSDFTSLNFMISRGIFQQYLQQRNSAGWQSHRELKLFAWNKLTWPRLFKQWELLSSRWLTDGQKCHSMTVTFPYIIIYININIYVCIYIDISCQKCYLLPHCCATRPPHPCPILLTYTFKHMLINSLFPMNEWDSGGLP